MNSIRPLTPFERGQAALADCLAHTDWAPDSDERLQWVAGLQAALDGVQVPAQALPAQALPDRAAALIKARALQDVLEDMAQSLAPLIGAHLKGDGAAVHRALTDFVNKHCKVVAPDAGSWRLQ